MPFPLNYTNREFANDSRPPAAEFARALSNLYEGFALIELRDYLSAQLSFGRAVEQLSAAAGMMQGLPHVEERWRIRNPAIFEPMLARLVELIGFVPTGDRAMIDHLVAEILALKVVIERYASFGGNLPSVEIPQDDEDQVRLIREILDRALRLQQVGLQVTQISLVTSQAGRYD